MVESKIASDLADALTAMSTGEYTPYAGGSDLMVMNDPNRKYLFISKIPELTRIYEDDEYIHVGAAVTFAEGLASPIIPPIMKEAISHIASPAIRNVGTFGGNICNGAGKADSVLVDFVCDALLDIRSMGSHRFEHVYDFCIARKKVDLQKDELLVEILLPKRECSKEFFFQKVSTRNALAISNISFAGTWSFDGDVLTSIALAIGAAGDTVIRHKDIENRMIGKTRKQISEDIKSWVDEYLDRMALPLDRTSVNYRMIVISNLITKLLGEQMG